MLPVTYTPVAEKYFKKLKDKPLKNAFKEAIMSIRANPDIGDAKTGDLKGLYRISHLENGDMVVIIMAGTRENFYKELKRYMK